MQLLIVHKNWFAKPFLGQDVLEECLPDVVDSVGPDARPWGEPANACPCGCMAVECSRYVVTKFSERCPSKIGTMIVLIYWHIQVRFMWFMFNQHLFEYIRIIRIENWSLETLELPKGNGMMMHDFWHPSSAHLEQQWIKTVGMGCGDADFSSGPNGTLGWR